MKRFVASLVVAGGVGAWALTAAADDTKDLPEDAKLMGEQHTIAVLPPADPKRLYVLEPVFPVFVAGKIWVIDGAQQSVLSVMSAGYAPNLALSPDASELYVFDTYWSLGFRGKRSDIVTVYDGLKLTISADIDLPKGRMLVVPKKSNAEISPDGSFLFSYNLAPSTTVSVIDAKARKHVADIDIPGCGLIFPSAPNRFSTLCSDGTLATATWDASLKAKITREPPFFDAENDPVFEHAAIDKKKGLVTFISYDGNLFPVDLSSAKPKIGGKWNFIPDADKAEGWRPGGWQVIGIHRPTQELYVLMHKGPRWSHKQAGEEVWVIDQKARKVVRRIHLKEHAISVALSQDAEPYLYTQTEKPSLITYDAKSGKEIGEMEFGISPYLLYTVGD
ncbi:MAG: hypothetical protein KIT73_08815 [Burkholderiales bacterium]|nr:hypothetical protein [Burkholderiales bacterium]